MAPSPFAHRLAELLQDIRRDYPDWGQDTVISQIRRSIPDYAHGIWRVAMPFNQGDSALNQAHAQRFQALREQAISEETVDLGHVVTSIDIGQSVRLIDSSFASWAGDLGTHVLANLAHGRAVNVGTSASMASLPDLHGDIDGDNIARHLPPGQAVEAVAAYYAGDEAFMDGVTWRSRYLTFARDLGLLDDDGALSVDKPNLRQAVQARALAFIELDELIDNVRHPLQALRELLTNDKQAEVEQQLDVAIEQFLALLAAGLAREQQ